MNRGLKSYTKQQELELANIGKAFINLNKADNNLILDIPLFETQGVEPISLSLIYNYLDRDVNNLFGKGFRLNHYKEIISKDDENYEVINSDGTIDEYKNNIVNVETNLVLTVTKENQFPFKKLYDLKDKYDNHYESEEFLKYPKRIKQKAFTLYLIDLNESGGYIQNSLEDAITFVAKDGLIESINVYYSTTKYYMITLEYNEQKLSIINYYEMRNDEPFLMNKIQLTYEDNKIICSDLMINHHYSFNIENNLFTSFKEYYVDSEILNELEFSYFDYSTIVKNRNGYKELHTFNGKFPNFTIDLMGNFSKTEYNYKTNLPISNSGKLGVYNVNNLLPGNNINIFNLNGSVFTKTTIDENIKEFFSDNFYYLDKQNRGNSSFTYHLPMEIVTTDIVTLILFVKCKLATGLSKLIARIYYDGIYYDGDNSNNYVIDNDNNGEGLHVIVLSNEANNCHSSIDLEIVLENKCELTIGDIILFKNDLGTFYEYDESGNLTSVQEGILSKSISYENNMPKETIGENSENSEYEFNHRNQLVKAKMSYGVSINNNYDQKYYTNVLKSTIKTADNNKIIETEKEYNTNGKFVVKEKDELNNGTTTKLDDYLGKIESVTSVLNEVTEYEYNADNTIKKMTLTLENKKMKKQYEYDDRKRLVKVILDNDDFYQYEYNNKDELIAVYYKGEKIVSFEYDEYHNIIKQSYDGINYYLFEYDAKTHSLIEKVKYVKKDEEPILKHQFVYDLGGRLIKTINQDFEKEVSIGKNEQIETINYRKKISDQMVKTLSTNYKYNHLKEKIYQNHDNYFHQTFDSTNRSKGARKEALTKYYENKTNGFFTIFLDSANIKNKSKEFEAKDNKGNKGTYTLLKEGVISKIVMDSNTELNYELDCKTYGEDAGNIRFFFKPKDTLNYQNLLTIKSRDGNSSLTVYMELDNLTLCVVDRFGSYRELVKTTLPVNVNEWNYFALNFYSRDDGQGFSNVSYFDLTLNTYTYSYGNNHERIYTDLGSNPIYSIGQKQGILGPEYAFDGEITCLYIGDLSYASHESILEYYRLCKDYMVDNELIDSDVKTVNFSQQTLFDPMDYDVFPFQNSIESIKGVRPSYFMVRKVSSYDKDRTFNFNNQLKKYALVCDRRVLEYKLNLQENATILINAFSDVRSYKQYFFELKDGNSFLGVYKDKNNNMIIKLDNNVINTNLFFKNDKWQTVCLSYANNMVSDSMTNTNTFDLRLMLDDKVFETSITLDRTFKGTYLSIGASFNQETNNDVIGMNSDYLPLYGQIEMLAYKNSFGEITTINELKENLKGVSKTHEYDELDMLRQTDLHIGGTSLLKNLFNYKTREDSRYLSHQINQETIKLKDKVLATRNYTLDDLGRLTKVDDPYFGTHSYTFDYRGYLVKEDNIDYTYDNNGNILTRGNVTYTYDSQNKDRLIKVGNEEIVYDELNKFVPKKYKNMTFKFDGRQLVELTLDNNLITYTYDEQGLRTSKKYLNKEINYYYEGDRLIREQSNDYTLDFIYDETNSLIGFIKDKKDKYFYIRDIYQNILGIIDLSGNIIVKYSYDAYGNILEEVSNEIGLLNPFRYKGYYYDNETKLYYCNSRYYSSELCRFISIDSINYLEPENINGLNLYCYCMNDPVDNVDPSGHFAISIGFLIGSILIGAAFGAGISGAVAYAEGERGWDLVWDIVGGAVMGAATGATIALGGAAGLGAVAGSAVTGVNVSFGAALGISIGSMAFANATKYSLDCAASDNQWNLGGYMLAGLEGATQGAATFGIAYVGGKAGLFNKLANFKTPDVFFTAKYGGMNSLRAFVWGSKVLIGETLAKAALVSGTSALARLLIDLIIPDLY